MTNNVISTQLIIIFYFERTYQEKAQIQNNSIHLLILAELQIYLVCGSQCQIKN